MAIILLTGCTSWQVRPGSPDVLIGEQNPELVRLTTVDGERVTLSSPTVRDSLIIGTVRQYYEYNVPMDEPRVVPVAAVAKTELRATDALLTTVLVMAVAGGGLLAFASMLGSAFDDLNNQTQ
jgi:hypothetical protein